MEVVSCLGWRALRGGRGAADKCHWGAPEVLRPHWVCPRLQAVLSPSTLLRLPAALQGAGPELHALPRPKALRSRFWVLHKDRLSWACVLCFPRPSSSGSQELDGCAVPRAVRLIPLRSQPQFPSAGLVGLVSVLGSWTLAATLPANVDRPNLRKSLVRSWKPVCRLVGVPSLGPSLPLSSPHCLLPLAGGLQPASSSLVFAQSFVLGTGG